MGELVLEWVIWRVGNRWLEEGMAWQAEESWLKWNARAVKVFRPKMDKQSSNNNNNNDIIGLFRVFTGLSP